MQTLLALAAIAPGALDDGSPEVGQDQTFEASDAIAEQLIATGMAKPFVAVPKGKTVKVRILADCALGRANDVVRLSSEDAQNAQNQGLADSSETAVAYALTLVQNQLTQANG